MSTHSEHFNMSGKIVYIIHGYMASPKDHWFEWLKSEIKNNGGTAEIISMPNSDNPDAHAWTQTLEKQIPALNDDVFIVAHSLGGITTLRFLNQHPNKKIGGAIFVSSFESKLPAIPDLDAFITPKDFDSLTIKSIIPKRAVFVSNNDPYVEPNLTKTLSESLDASLIEIDEGGHFLSDDGYTEFPKLWQTLSELVKPSRL